MSSITRDIIEYNRTASNTEPMITRYRYIALLKFVFDPLDSSRHVRFTALEALVQVRLRSLDPINFDGFRRVGCARLNQRGGISHARLASDLAKLGNSGRNGVLGKFCKNSYLLLVSTETPKRMARLPTRLTPQNKHWRNMV